MQVSQEAVMMLLGGKEIELMQMRVEKSALEARLIMAESQVQGLTTSNAELQQRVETLQEIAEMRHGTIEELKRLPAVTDLSKLTICPDDLKALIAERDDLKARLESIESSASDLNTLS
jgi:predicted nuclease with TOPRIM domain